MPINIIMFQRGTIDVMAHGSLVTRPIERNFREGRFQFEPVIAPGEGLYQAPDGEFFIGKWNEEPSQ